MRGALVDHPLRGGTETNPLAAQAVIPEHWPRRAKTLTGLSGSGSSAFSETEGKPRFGAASRCRVLDRVRTPLKDSSCVDLLTCDGRAHGSHRGSLPAPVQGVLQCGCVRGSEPRGWS